MGKEINLPSSEIDSDNPWGDDKLNRSHVAQTLTKLITGKEQPLVVSLSGGWGTGKTFMLHNAGRKIWKKGAMFPFILMRGKMIFAMIPLWRLLGKLHRG